MPLRDIRLALARASILVVMLLSGCGGEAGTGPAPPPPPAPPTPPPPPAPPPPAVPTSVAVTPRNVAFTALGDSLDMVAEVTDQHGAPMPNATVTWRIGDETVASVRAIADRQARIAAVGAGQASLVASAGDASATVAVTVEQTPASLHTVGDDLSGRTPGMAVRVSAEVRDRNGHPAADIRVDFRVEEGGGSVDPASVVTGTEGRAATSWTLGASGTQALSATAAETSARFNATLCTLLLLEPGLKLG